MRRVLAIVFTCSALSAVGAGAAEEEATYVPIDLQVKTNQKLDEAFRFAKRYGTPLSVIIGDVDHFKQINDRLGHARGDEVLKNVARTLQQGVREVDVVGRWGGEEFLVVLPNTPLSDGHAVAERLRSSVEEGCRLAHGPVTVSFGLAGYDGDQTVDGLVQRSDQALYDAKRNGRNQVVVR